jgi:hypothetical protein
VGRGRNIILAHTSQIAVMKNWRKWAVETNRLAYNGIKVLENCILSDNILFKFINKSSSVKFKFLKLKKALFRLSTD